MKRATVLHILSGCHHWLADPGGVVENVRRDFATNTLLFSGRLISDPTWRIQLPGKSLAGYSAGQLETPRSVALHQQNYTSEEATVSVFFAQVTLLPVVYDCAFP